MVPKIYAPNLDNLVYTTALTYLMGLESAEVWVEVLAWELL